MEKFKTFIIGLMLAFPLIFTSCTKDLANTNVNPNTNTNLTYDAQFLYVQSSAHATYGQFVMSFYPCVTQQLSAIVLGTAPGDKYWTSEDNLGSMFTTAYTTTIKNVVDLISRTKDDPELSNYYNIARIMKVFAFHEITDSWGDVPYSEAGKAYSDLNFTPKYDTQESIYMDFFNELNSAIPALDASKATYTSDSYYQGDITKWKKLGYSLMLRLAMRIQKVKPDLAKQWANTAVAGGVFTSNNDNQVFHHAASGSPNQINNAMTSNFNRFRVAKTLVDMLKNTNDPRLNIFCEPYSGSVLEGLPNGLDATTLSYPANNPLGLSFNEFAYFNHTIMDDLSAPSIWLNYSEMCFLQAEAVLRGWITGDATALYNAGVTASMKMWGIYSGITVPSDVEIQAYLTAHPFDGSYEMIGNQMYLTNWRNFIEGFSNWRRTGYPVLTPINYPNNQTNGAFPRRIPYDGCGVINTGVLQNMTNYEAAVARQGADTYTTRVWWDVAK